MKTAIVFLVVSLSSLALSQQTLFKRNASGPLSIPQGKQYPVREFSHDPDKASRHLDILSQAFDPWVKQLTGAPIRHTGCMMQAVDSNTFWSVFEAPDAPSSQEYVRTTNGGKTWLCDTVHAAPSAYKSVSIFAFDSNRAWVLMGNRVTRSGGALFHTMDGGRIWKEDTTVFKNAGSAPDFIYFFDADNGVAVGDPPADGYFEIYTTSNGGANWSRVPRENIPALSAGELSAKTHEFTAAGSSLWFPTIGGQGRFFRTTDKGQTWSARACPKKHFWYWSPIEFQDESVGLCNGGWGDVEKTIDGGVTWTAIPTSMNLAFQDLEYVPHTPGMYVASAAWSYTSLVRPIQYGTLYTLDGGVHWTIATATASASIPANLTLPVLSFASPASGWQGDMSGNIFKWTVPSGRIAGVHPDSLIFTTLESGVSSDTILVDFVNHGADPITVSDIIIPGTEFTVIRKPPLPVTLSSLGSARVELCFTPRTQGVHRDSLVFVSDASNAPRASVLLEGNGMVFQPAVSGGCYAAGASLYDINITSGTPTAIGSLGQLMCYGLAVRPSTGILYGVVSGTEKTTLYRVSCESAFASAVQTFPVSDMYTIAFDRNDDLYGATLGGRLYKLDLATGDTIGIGTAPDIFYRSIAFSPSGKLWASVYPENSGKDNIYTINKATGQAALVGSTGDGNYTPSIFFAPNGKMYGLKGVDAEPNSIISIDTLTGVGTAICSTGMNGIFSMTMAVLANPLHVEPGGSVPLCFSLEQNYPNPFNPTTTFQFSIAQRAMTTLNVYDVLGREVATLVNEMKEPGAYTVQWDATKQPSGLYFYRLQSGPFTETKKMLLIH